MQLQNHFSNAKNCQKVSDFALQSLKIKDDAIVFSKQDKYSNISK